VIPESGTGSSYAMHDYGRILRRRWPLLLLGLLVGLGLAAAAMHYRAHTYTSEAQVQVAANSFDTTTLANARTTGEINLDTEAQLVTSAKVAKGARKLLRVSTPARELVGRVSVTVPPNTSILDITNTAGTASEAKQGAHAFAQAYLDNRAQVAKSQSQSLVQARQDQITKLTSQLQDVTGKLAALPPNSPELAFDQAQADLLKTQIGQLTGELTTLTASDLGPGSIITDAQEPTDPASPSPLIFMAGGVMAGLLLGLCLALLRERMDKRVRRSDIERYYGIPVLATTPRLRQRPGDAQPLAGGAQPYALLQSSVAALLGERRVLVVAPLTSAEAGDQVATNLAAAMAGRQGEVVLVRTVGPLGSRQQPAPPTATGAELDLSAVARSAVRSPALPRLRTIDASGEASPLRSVLLGRDAGKVLEALRSSADLVVLSVAPLPSSADAQAIARLADAALLVVETGRAHRADITGAERILQRLSIPVLGAAEFPRTGSLKAGTDTTPAREAVAPPRATPPSVPPSTPPPPSPAPPATETANGASAARQPVTATAVPQGRSVRADATLTGDSGVAERRAE